jgi:hypothetical protein
VRAISSRLIRVVGVTLSVFTAEVSLLTTTDCWTDATWSSKCNTGVVSEATVMLCVVVLKPV